MSTATTALAAVCAALRSAGLAHHASAVEAMPLESADLRALGAARNAAKAAQREHYPWHRAGARVTFAADDAEQERP